MNKILVSIVFAVILVIGINKITNVVYHVEKPETSAFQVNVTTVADTENQKSSESSQDGDIMTLFASTNAAEGAAVFKKCLACHSIAREGKNKIGPKLFGVMGRQVGSISDYKYSKAMAAYKKVWTIEEMNNFLIKPKAWIKGTKMSFVGLKNAKDRAAVILYMNDNTDNPLQLQ